MTSTDYLFTPGVWFVGDTNITVGDNTSISCLSDLTVQRVEWVFSGAVVSSSLSQRVDLSFSPVQEYLHNREYTCRAVTQYGTLERSVRISVYSKCIYRLCLHESFKPGFNSLLVAN